MANKVRGKYRVQVSMDEREYQKIRKMAFEMEVTVNECLRIVALEAVERYVKDE